ncbi:NupC/NupG family nucleoside CNT transporter [Virgibacillus soli]|uniref:Nucleoside transporter C-terminal domain-containing protein n=1 Tax=Paracerasibacillus soli TaxID=480284 RepID=A0ABU5CUI4_9BACI|nr:nucleoside transporter C-terminal domain-containing protein [Virgibacillus soli]MDY0409895.1 nucleoside transporter C-terminal domain-containing protein [Virgibacillus soli]
MQFLIGILGLLVFLGIAWAMSKDRKNINFRAIGIMFGMQIVLTFLMLNTNIGLRVLNSIGNVFTKLVEFGLEGVDFVVGGWIPEGQAPFFINVLLIIVFTSTILSVLTHIKVLPLLIKWVGGGLSKITGLPKVESFVAVGSVFFGQSEVFLMIKNQLATLNRNRLFIISTSAMGSVSASIVGSYIAMIPPKFVFTAMVLNMFSALIMSSTIFPVKVEKDDEQVDIKGIVQTRNVFDAISNGALDGGKIALIVASQLIAYVGLIALVNAVLNGLAGVDLQTILGYVFAPIAFIMGTPIHDIMQVGGLMGTKLVTNEFVGMLSLQDIANHLSPKGQAIISTYLVSFSNFSSIGIIAGSVQALNGQKAKEISSFGLKLLFVASLASAFSATIVGLFI